jgi:formimidoylglutamate deiminase
VHATQTEPAELDAIARSGAVVGLCPATEANLGDGIFGAPRFLAQGGRFGVGSDSNVCVDPFEELRLLELAQRLVSKRRNVLAGQAAPDAERSVGSLLLAAALSGGAQAAGQPTSELAPGRRADLVVLDAESPGLLGREGEALVDAAIFGPGRRVVRDVLCAGRFCVREGRHVDGAAIRTRYARAIARLQG